MSTTSFAVPPGYHPPFAVISDSDHGGWIIIACSLGLAMATLSTLIRIYVKTISRQHAGIDDLLLAGATCFAFVLQSLLLAACGRGLGRTVDRLPESQLRRIEKEFYSSQLLAVFALGLCKCSVASFIMRLTPKTTLRRTLLAIQAAVVLWMIAAVLSFALQCDLDSPWRFASAACHGVYTRVLIIGVLDIILEVAIFTSAILLVGRLQTTLHKRAMVVLAFGLRLPVIGFTAARIATFDQAKIADFAIAESLYIIWTVTEINYSLIATTLPILRPFIVNLSTYYGTMPRSEYGSGTGSRSDNYALSTFRSRPSVGNAKGSLPSGTQTSKDRPNEFVFSTQITTHCEAGVHTSRPSSSHSLATDDSQRMIIQVETDIVVERGT